MFALFGAGMFGRLAMFGGGGLGIAAIVSFISALFVPAATAAKSGVVKEVILKPAAEAVVSTVVSHEVQKFIDKKSDPKPERKRKRKPTIIRPQQSVENWGEYGCCAWATAATLLNEAGHERMADWVRRFKSNGPEGASFAEVAKCLNDNGYSSRAIYRMSDVVAAIEAGRPVGYVCKIGRGYHARTLVDIDFKAKTAAFVDCNDHQRQTTVALDVWERQWHSGGGSGLVVDRRAR